VNQPQSHKAIIEKQIVDIAISQFEQNKLTNEDLITIADFTVEGLKNVSSQGDLNGFLTSLANRWSFFTNIATIEEGASKTAVENEVYNGVLALAKHGKIDEAVKLAKTVTN
jgi:hypothetical protein